MSYNAWWRREKECMKLNGYSLSLTCLKEQTSGVWVWTSEEVPIELLPHGSVSIDGRF